MPDHRKGRPHRRARGDGDEQALTTHKSGVVEAIDAEVGVIVSSGTRLLNIFWFAGR